MNVFTLVTWKTLKKNKSRTLVTVVGILLATAMLTAVTTIISSLQSFMIRSVIAERGDWHGAIFQLSQEEAGEIAGALEVENAGVYQELGFGLLPDGRLNERPYVFVAGMTEELYNIVPVKLVDGRLPQNGEELLISKNFLSWSGMSLKIGDTVSLDLGRRYLDGVERGVCEAAVYGNDKETLAEELVTDKTRSYTVVGIAERIPMDGYQRAALFALTSMEEASGPDATFTCYYKMHKPSQAYAFTEALRYQGSSSNRTVMRMLYGLATILIVLIMVGGISLVYNSFAISVSDRTKQFGLLASVGATPRQMRGMVLKEAFLVSALGIPLGVLSGLVGIAITLRVTGNAFQYLYSGKVPMQLAVSVPALAIAVTTALSTVLLSAWIPARRAAKISPMDAIRQTKDIRIPKKIRKSGKWSYRFFGLSGMVAGKHFTRSRRQYRATIFSLFISIVLFISASSFSDYVRNSISRVNAVADYDISVHTEETEGYERLRKRLSRMEGVEETMAFGNAYSDIHVDEQFLNKDYLELLENNGVYSREDMEEIFSILFVMEDEAYVRYLEEEGLSVEEFTDPQNIQAVALDQIEGFMAKEERYRICRILKEAGCDVDLILTDYVARDEAWKELDDTEEYLEEPFQRTVRLKVGALTERAPMNMVTGGDALRIFLSESMFEALVDSPADYLPAYSIRVKAPEHQAVAKQIENLAYEEEWADIDYYVNDETESVQLEKSMLFTLDVFTYGFIVLISLIAAANVFNTISTGFLLRRKEFAVLASVGMASGEMRRMLQYECLLYGGKALLYGIPVSLLVTWQIFQVVKSGMDTGFYVPLLSIALAVCSVFVVVFSTMLYARKKLEKENLIDSIRRESV